MPFQMMLSRRSPYFKAIMPSLPSLTFESLKRTYVSYCNDAAHDHDDVKMNLFALSLEDDAIEWYFDLVMIHIKPLMNS